MSSKPDEQTTSLRRSSRSTRGSVKPVVDLTKPVELSDQESDDEKEPTKVKPKPKGKSQPRVAVVTVDSDDDEVEIIPSDQEDNDDEDFEATVLKGKGKAKAKRQSTASSKPKTETKSVAKGRKKGVKKEIDPEQEPEIKVKATKKSSKSHSKSSGADEKVAAESKESITEEVEILYELSEREMKEINQAFDANCPGDGDEQLDSDHLKTALRSLGFEPRADEIKKLVKKFGNTRGQVNRDGLHKIMAFKFGSTPGKLDDNSNDEISRVFNLLDLDKTGMITLENLRSISRELNEEITDEELHEMIQEADVDGDFQINKQEFYNIMKKTSLY